MLIVYEGCGEVIVCSEKGEAESVQEYFMDGGRDMDEYDRSVVSGALVMTPSIRVEKD